MSDLRYYIDLAIELLKKELKVRYKSSILGYFWSVAVPILQAIIYYYAFKFVVKISIDNYSIFLLTGLFPWQWFSNSATSSIFAIVGNAQLIKKTSIPREILIVSSVLNDTIHFLLSIPVIFFLIILSGLSLSILSVIALLILVFVQFILTLGVAFAVSAVGVYFRDIERLLIVFLNLLFYLCPIVYDKNMIPEQFLKPILIMNPMFSIIDLYRSILLYNEINSYYWFIAIGQAVLVFFLGLYIFRKLKWRFPELL